MIIEKQIALGAYNSFKINHCAEYFCKVKSVSDILKALEFLEEKKIPFFILGLGSNILLSKDFRGLIIKNEIEFVKLVSEDTTQVILQAGAGNNWDNFVAYCVNYNYYGVENLSLIPSTVGATAMQNIGAYGVEVCSVIEKVEYINIKTKTIKIITNKECQFGYRNSIFKNELKDKIIITSVFFKLQKQGTFNLNYPDIITLKEQKKLNLEKVRNKIVEVRTSKLSHPKEYGNAGSFFKNPIISKTHFEKLKINYPNIISYQLAKKDDIKISAAWLIEYCDWKGKKIAKVAISPKHALILINTGGATGQDILTLAAQVEKSVFEKFNISLEKEVVVI